MDHLGIIQLFLIAKYMRSYFQTYSSKFFDFFFFNNIMVLWERLRGADAELHPLGHPRHWSAICLGKTEHSAVLPGWISSNLLPWPPIRKGMRQQLKTEEYSEKHKIHFLIGNCFKTIQYLCC